MVVGNTSMEAQTNESEAQPYFAFHHIYCEHHQNYYLLSSLSSRSSDS
jgi:hypothetical protein